ncbi:hypothetical protein MJO29_016262 [Puccinia striiformis f. sp. tritici]|uniref:SBDS family rRNA metabolism protein n=1 Tax=Puccinia striiformis f. sp. tritici PST-78 TaxID=1165861 RepID=A0A0L0VZI1_9BASI|nr:hypothetical protein Pst134EA_030506 [Puccinia striiformis f. sp. tritici]KAI9600558.1 hypothetical protein H4Q26_000344 [Puccinia striiformis f. sp. tritici PST-130]KNF04607.1 hypothetical protein PSTG_02095 [Puccinia striiformis f. sp. tritici PST-78]KAH9440438.1 hypothetical protein Pst134EB_031050 [Puccinia striiformis f. sp. tritici]KAH9446595.1 hypothetical protein Pst134EA_030506 [Puccinia striiformis f. sp. tritici]KAI7934999.1 hypothetical protein MJO29_016262 [Puccinia striiformis
MPVFQPSNQIKLTNVSIVRLKKAGKRFEIACYKNKVMEWRSGVETDLSEVVQSDTIFSNVSKGQLASHSDLLKSFPSKHQPTSNKKNAPESGLLLPSEEILLEILKNGELQVSDKERAQALIDKKKEIIHLIAEKTVDPTTNRPHTSSMIEKSLDELHFSVNLSKNSKTQALELIKALSTRSDIISISRSQMKIRITLPTNTNQNTKKLKTMILEKMNKVELDETDQDQCELIGLIDPGQFKLISDLLNSNSNRKNNNDDHNNNSNRFFKLETISLTAEQVEGDEQL